MEKKSTQQTVSDVNSNQVSNQAATCDLYPYRRFDLDMESVVMDYFRRKNITQGKPEQLFLKEVHIKRIGIVRNFKRMQSRKEGFLEKRRKKPSLNISLEVI